MQSSDDTPKMVNAIRCTDGEKFQGKDISVCVNYSDDADEEDADALANAVSDALKFRSEMGKALIIAQGLATDNQGRIARDILRVCRENIEEFEDAGIYAPTVALTAAVIIEDYALKLAAAQQRNETLQMMLNHDKGQADAK